ncbi:MAG: bifunctional 4-hydroxy-2-oxoglutarate aldolase/2-dehydro-3-deoxy-phosphogluconate aldolase [Clostridium sp.]|jgi:2-dehydro-3-deoxyphosphogluconate aldolase/(4S)-4-hydroxy-2-oxoglutarate aldolase|nr:bifunctional 4-hydroxy-2-oxoglutarate aldolase/2-dehydro-3-deoxy-phosphogluconate aldolase [Clostridium sp.]
MQQILSRLRAAKVLPVLSIKNAEQAVPLAQALLEGGLSAVEVTFRTPAAAQAISQIRSALPQMFVAAGTVLTKANADAAKSAGAQLAISPGISREMVEHCKKIELPLLPGCATPSELTLAVELGFGAVKLFPAKQLGGVEYLKALAAPFGGISFVPTGGIDLVSLAEYLALPQVVACGGSFMVKEEWLAAGAWDKIAAAARESVLLAGRKKNG